MDGKTNAISKQELPTIQNRITFVGNFVSAGGTDVAFPVFYESGLSNAPIINQIIEIDGVEYEGVMPCPNRTYILDSNSYCELSTSDQVSILKQCLKLENGLPIILPDGTYYATFVSYLWASQYKLLPLTFIKFKVLNGEYTSSSGSLRISSYSSYTGNDSFYMYLINIFKK